MKVNQEKFERFLSRLDQEVNFLIEYSNSNNFKAFYSKFKDIAFNVSEVKKNLNDKQTATLFFSEPYTKLKSLVKNRGILY